MTVPTVLVTVKMAAKLFVLKLPLVPAVRWSALVLPLPIVHVTRMLVATRVIDVMPKNEALLVGSVPARNSCRFVNPSPSASAGPSAGWNGSKP